MNQRNLGAKELARGKMFPATTFWKVWLAFQSVEEVNTETLAACLFLSCLWASQSNQSSHCALWWKGSVR